MAAQAATAKEKKCSRFSMTALKSAGRTKPDIFTEAIDNKLTDEIRDAFYVAGSGKSRLFF